MKHLFASLFISTLAAVSGCASHAGTSSSVPEGVVVRMGLHDFEPAKVTITAGQSVRWHNTSMIWHTVTADPSLAKRAEDVALPQGVQAFDSGKVGAGKTYEHTFTVPGTYRYFCQPHELKGMVGEVVVSPVSGSAAAGGPLRP